MKRIFKATSLILVAVLSLALSSLAQMKTRKPAKKPAAGKVKAVTVSPVETTETKKNARPEAQADGAEVSATPEPHKKNQAPKAQVRPSTAAPQESKNGFFYEFTQPNFVLSRVVIEHDDNGKGKITFEKKDFGEPVTEPIQLSAASLEKIKNLVQTLNFIDSTENYQSTIRDYSHLGTMKIHLKKDDKQRSAVYNWTENKDARALTDEYRRIGEQFVWIFDMSVSRENQPLEAPGLMDRLDSLLRRNEISDPTQMVPLLKKLSDDERIPLIARNHANRIVKEIEKKAK